MLFHLTPVMSFLMLTVDEPWVTGRPYRYISQYWCYSYQRWLVFFHFSAVSCGNPGTPAHGRIVLSDGITFGSSVAYACLEGFKTSGLTTRHCTTNGTWTGQPPDCTGKIQLISILIIIVNQHYYKLGKVEIAFLKKLLILLKILSMTAVHLYLFFK